MNMISTGAFQNEMDASNNQPTLAGKFAAVWEKKNAKAARAGGVSLMALSLAACGSDDDSSSSSSSGSSTTSTTSSAAQTFALTTGIDSVAGGSGDDVINGGATSAATQTFNTLDTIVGGAGTDTLSAVMYANATPGTSGVELYNVSASAAATLDMTGSSGVTSINNTGSTALLSVTNIGTDTALNLSSTASGGTFNYAASTVTGTADAKSVTISGVTGGTLNMGTGVETLTVDSTGSANTLAGLSTSATTLNITGSANLTINAAGELTAQTTIDASASTGSISLQTDTTAATSITTGSGNDSITADGSNAVVETISTGLGNDTVTFDGNLANTDVIDGGDGTDTLASTFALLDGLTNATAANDNVSNFEKVTFTTAFTSGQTFNVASVQAAGITTVTSDDLAFAGAATINFIAGASTLNVAAVLGGDLNVDAAGTALDDALAINVTDSGADAINAENIVSTDFETLTISTSGTGLDADQTLGAVTMTASTGGTTAVSFVGDNAIDNSGVITAATIDFSGVTDTDGVIMGAAAAGVTTITGSAGADTLVGDASSTINAGAGNDTITGGAGNDVLNGGAGDDTFENSAGADTIDGGAGNDTIKLSTGLSTTDTIAGGDGTGDVLQLLDEVAVTSDSLAVFSGFEILHLAEGALTGSAQTLNMSNFGNNHNAFTRIDLGDQAGDSLTVNNIGSAVAEVRFITGAASDTFVMDQLVDGSADVLTLSSRAAQTVTAFTHLDAETINVSGSAAANNLVVSTLTVGDTTTINITGAADVNLGTVAYSGSGALKLATVDASAATGTIVVNASGSTVGVTMTGNSTNGTEADFTGSAYADVIGGSAGNDTGLTGGNGADTINGYAGNDTILGGAGADTITAGSGDDEITGGTGADTITLSSGAEDVNVGNDDSVAATSVSFAGSNVAAGDTMTFGNGVDVVNGFTAGGGADDITTGDAANIAVTHLGQAHADLTGDANENLFLSGNWDTSSNTFTITGNGQGSDMMIVNGQHSDATNDSLTLCTNVTIFTGVDTDDIVAGDFSA
jgi:hypothetical protein